MSRPAWAFGLAGLAAALALAVLAAPHASQAPDGLEKVAEEQGFAKKAEGGPAPGIGGKRSKALAGALGTIAVFLAGIGAGALLRRRKSAAGN